MITARGDKGLGSARLQRAGFGILPKQSFEKVAIAWRRSPARYKRALPRTAAARMEMSI
jgi:hypothetical protein